MAPQNFRVVEALLFALALAATAIPAPGQCQDPTQVLRGSDGYGYDIAMDGDVMAVARHELHVNAAVHIYEREGSRWQEVAEFHLGGPFGVPYRPSVDVSGDRLVAGLSGTDAVSVFHRDSGGWRLEQVLALDQAWPEAFGYEVAIDGETILVPFSRDNGSVHIYELSSLGWVWTGALRSPDPEDTSFGASIALDGDVAAVLARRSPAHAVLIFRRSGGAWALEADVPIELPITGNHGRHIDVDGDRLIVATGSLLEPAHIYRFDGDDWGLAARLGAAHRLSVRGVAVDSVAIDGARALVAKMMYDGDLGRPGVAYLYELREGSWSLRRRLLHRDMKAHDYGAAAELEDRWAVLSAPERAGSGPYGQGAVYAFDLEQDPDPCPVPPHSPDNGLRLLIDGMLTPQTPETLVQLQAFFVATAPDSAFAGTLTTVEATEAGWRDPEVIAPGEGTRIPGVIDGGRVAGIAIFQYSGAWIVAPPTNPIDLWQARFTSDDFAPRVITVTTDTRLFDVYPSAYVTLGIPAWESRIAGMPEAEARIRVWRSSCLGDCDGSAALDFLDFLCFQGLVSEGNLAADLDDDGALTFFDFLAFQNAFAGGCP